MFIYNYNNFILNDLDICNCKIVYWFLLLKFYREKYTKILYIINIFVYIRKLIYN